MASRTEVLLMKSFQQGALGNKQDEINPSTSEKIMMVSLMAIQRLCMPILFQSPPAAY